MAYKSPGVTVINEFQQIISASTGGPLLLGVVAGFDSSNVEFLPTRTLSFRKEDIKNCLFDFASIDLPKNALFPILDDDRIKTITSGINQYYFIKNVPDYATWDGSIYTRTDPSSVTYFQLMEITRGNSSSDTSDAINNNITSPVFPVSSSNKTWLYYFNKETAKFNAYEEGVDFSIQIISDVSNKKVEVTWLRTPDIRENEKYYVLVLNSTANFSDLASGNDVSENPKGYQCAVFLHKGTNNNLGLVVYWFDANKAPEPATSYDITIRYEVIKGANLFLSYDDVVRTFGPLVYNGQINEPSFAGWLAFSEGASSICISIYDKNNLPSVDEAFTALSLRDDITHVTVIDSNFISDSSTTLTYKLYEHVKNTSSDIAKKYRIGLYHPYFAITSSSTISDILNKFDTETLYVNSNRMILCAPFTVSFNIPTQYGTLTKYTFNGGYLGLIYGAMLSRAEYDAATSLLRKPSNTIVELEPVWDDKLLDRIASKGVTLFSKINGQFTVRDDITTSRAGDEFSSDPVITQISDNITKDVINIIDKTLIGSKIRGIAILEAIKAKIISLLDRKAADGLITSYGTPSLSFDPLSPKKVIGKISIVPVFTFKELVLTFSYVAKL